MKEKKKHVCHLTSVHPPFDIRVFQKECVSLNNHGYKVTLIAPINEQTHRDGITVVPIKIPGNRLLRIIIVTLKMFQLALKQKASLYHFHDPELMLCGVLLRLSGKKVIYDIHENVRLTILDKPYLSLVLRKIIYWGYRLFEKMCLPFYNQYVLALSEETYFKYYKPSKSTIILNFPKKVVANMRKCELEEPYRFIYTGAVFEYRGIFEMIQLAEKLKSKGINFKMDIVGKVWSKELERNIEKQLKEKQLEEIIIFHGFVDAEKVAGFISKAHMGISLLHPFIRYQEALPTKIFEYMQQGLPVITNNFKLLIDYVEKTGTGICLDIQKLDEEVDKIISLLGDTERIKKMGEKGVQLTTEKWNWESQASKLIKLYEKLLS